MSKEYYKKKLIDLRRYISDEREAKKRDNDILAHLPQFPYRLQLPHP